LKILGWDRGEAGGRLQAGRTSARGQARAGGFGKNIARRIFLLRTCENLCLSYAIRAVVRPMCPAFAVP
jgi:hypothetical protein